MMRRRLRSSPSSDEPTPDTADKPQNSNTVTLKSGETTSEVHDEPEAALGVDAGDSTQTKTQQVAEQGADEEDESFKWTCRIPRWLFWGVVSFFVSTAVMLVLYVVLVLFVFRRIGVSAPSNMMEEIGVDGIMLFRKHDRDDDGYLSLGEFEPIAHLLRDTNATFEYPTEINETDDVITIRSYFQPLVLNTMTKDLDSMFAGSLDSLTGLKTWQNPNIHWMNFGTSDFKVFLPKSESAMNTVGEAYYIIEDLAIGMFQSPVSSNRYYPPKIKDEEVLFHRLLTLLHPRPFIHMRFDPKGSTAIIRAYNDQYVDIAFRMHVEFQLNEPPFYPFWFTPAQFSGHLVIDRDATSILYFNMYVPTVKQLNVDMEWLNGPREHQNMEVDIGFVPQMQVNSSCPSVPASTLGTPGNYADIDLPLDLAIHETLDAIEWTEEITMQEAYTRLEKKMYKFKEALEKDESQPEEAEWAKLALLAYEFPVQMLVALPNGTVVHGVNANRFLDEGSSGLSSPFDSDPSGKVYLKFLEDGIKNAEVYRSPPPAA